MSQKAQRQALEIREWEDILDIKDLRSAVTLMKDWQVDASGVKSLEMAIDRLISHWIEKKGSIEITESQKTRGFEDAMAKHKQIRAKLTKYFEDAHSFCEKLVPSIQKNLESCFEGLNELFKEKTKSLKTGECTILIAGEVGAGKSSLLNLLIGNQLFPTDAVQCTNTICEIRCSEVKEARLFLKQAEFSDSGERDRKVAPKILTLDGLKKIQELKDCIVQCDEDGNNPYERIEVYWPLQMLGKGVVIVDTPGIEGGNNVDHSLTKYLSKAFGFIYVINTNAAGGVQRGRLGHLLNTVINLSDDFSPESSIFIGNKWENIPDSDKEDVRRSTFTSLNKIYPGISPSQLHFMSVKKASEVSMKYKARTRQHEMMLKMLEHLIPSCLKQGLINQYFWLSEVLKRTSYLLRVTSLQHAMSQGDLEQKKEELKEHVKMLQRNTDESLCRLREKVEFEMFRINADLKEFLNSTRFLNKMCDWEDPRDCPKKERSWKLTTDAAALKIAERLTREIDIWEKENQKLKRIDIEIVDVFSKEFGLMEHQVKELEDVMLRNRGGQGVFFHTMKMVPVKALFTKKKKKIEKTYSTLGGAVSCIGMLDTSNKKVRGLFRDFKDDNKREKMAEATMIFLEGILNYSDLQGKLRKFFSRFIKDIDEAAKRIPMYLQADQQLIETISQRLDNISRASELFPEQLDTCSKIHTDLDIMYVNSVMKFDLEPEELDMANRKLLGSGAFANVYESVIRKKNRGVAIKVSKEVVNRSNISDILMEDRTMRDLKHPYVIKYYGATYEMSQNSIRFIMIMEKCSKSLKDIYTGPCRLEAFIPGAHLEGDKHLHSATRKMATHGYQLSQGLEYIHGKGYTHRDIKLENILLSFEDTVKITDVGIAKLTDLLVKTCNGSPAYMAPEVLLATRNHSNKIDIYSLSFILWEMWFGRDVTDDMNNVILGPGFQGDAMSRLKERQAKADGGFRPSLKSANKPPPRFAEMIKRGWAYNPDERPNAKEFVSFFKDFLANN